MTNEQKIKLRAAIAELEDFHGATNFKRVVGPIVKMREVLEADDWTPAENDRSVAALINSLGKWKQRDGYEVTISPNPEWQEHEEAAVVFSINPYPRFIVILHQGMNTIRLN